MNTENTPPSGKDDSSLVENKANASAATENTPPSGKDDSNGVKSLAAKMFDGVKAIYKAAWTRDRSTENVLHVFIDIAVSVIAPVAVVWSAIDTRVTYFASFSPFFYLFLVFLPFIGFVFACYVLTKQEKDIAPLLAFSVLLFLSGALFTAYELIGHTNKRTIPCFHECTVVEKNWLDCVSAPPECDERDRGGNPPWGDFFLAFSAFCVIVEEFSPLGIYYNVIIKRKVKEAKSVMDAASQDRAEQRKMMDAASRSRAEQIELMKDAAREHAELLELKKSAKKEHDELAELHRSMSEQSKKWHESRQAVLFKACSVVAIIVLAFTLRCG